MANRLQFDLFQPNSLQPKKLIGCSLNFFSKKFAGAHYMTNPLWYSQGKEQYRRRFGMRCKMIFGQTLFSFFHEGRHDLRIKEVRFLNRDLKGEINGSTRLLYDEASGTIQRYVNGSAPIASLPDDMVCFLAEVSRCFGRLTGDMSWEKDVWLCVDTEVIPEKEKGESESDGREVVAAQSAMPPVLTGGMAATTPAGCHGAGY